MIADLSKRVTLRRDFPKARAIASRIREQLINPREEETVNDKGLVQIKSCIDGALFMSVQEVVLELGHSMLRKLVWCLPRFEEVNVSGVANPLIHINYALQGLDETKMDPWSTVPHLAMVAVRRSFMERYSRGEQYDCLKYRVKNATEDYNTGLWTVEREQPEPTWRDRPALL